MTTTVESATVAPQTESTADARLAREWHDTITRYHHTACALDRALEAGHGISHSDFEVLQQLSEYGGDACSLKLNDLAAHVHLSQSALSRLVARLEQDGLMQRTMCTQDRRAVFATITPAGRAVFEAARPTQRAVLRAAASR